VIRVYTLGRSAEQSIDVGPDFKRVSRRHAEIAVLGPNAYRITDLGSANGTEVFDGHRWISVSQATISRDQRFRLGGEFEATVEALIRQGYEIPAKEAATADTESVAVLPSPMRDRIAQLVMLSGCLSLIFGVILTTVQMLGEIRSGNVSAEPCVACKITKIGELDFKTRYPGIAVSALGVVLLITGYWLAARGSK